jgi:hypothetical protein
MFSYKWVKNYLSQEFNTWKKYLVLYVVSKLWTDPRLNKSANFGLNNHFLQKTIIGACLFHPQKLTFLPLEPTIICSVYILPKCAHSHFVFESHIGKRFYSKDMAVRSMEFWIQWEIKMSHIFHENGWKTIRPKLKIVYLKNNF